MDNGTEFPCEQHEKELETIRAVAEASRRDLAVMQEILRRLDKAIFGNGKPGILDRLELLDSEKVSAKVLKDQETKYEADFKQLENRVDNHDRYIWLGLGIMLAMQFLSGNGIISLKGFIGK